LFLKKIKHLFLKNSLFVANSILLLFLVLNFTLYSLKIDPQVQYFDLKTIYHNKESTSEKINEQYYINWKTNEKIYLSNRVYDFGPFRNYLERNVDINKLGKNWIKVE